MKTLLLISFISLLLLTITCNKKNNLFDHYKNKPEEFFNIDYNPSQSADSVVILDTKKSITTTGMEIYEIITKAEKRRQDSFTEQWLKNPYPYDPETRTIYAEQKEKSLFTLCVYDSTGDEIARLVNDELFAGEYYIDFSALSFFPPGKYFYEIKCYNYQSVRQFEVREKRIN